MSELESRILQDVGDMRQDIVGIDLPITVLGRLKLHVFDEEALAHAIRILKKSKNVRSPFGYLVTVASDWSRRHGVKIDWRIWFDLCNAYDIPIDGPFWKDGTGFLIKQDAPSGKKTRPLLALLLEKKDKTGQEFPKKERVSQAIAIVEEPSADEREKIKTQQEELQKMAALFRDTQEQERQKAEMKKREDARKDRELENQWLDAYDALELKKAGRAIT